MIVRAVACALLAACASAPPPPSPAGPDATELPLLHVRPLAPIHDHASFAGEGRNVEWSAKDPSPLGDPWPSDSAAVDAATGWVVDHFGALAADVTLAAKSIDHSATGDPVAQRPADRGHTIVLEQCWRGHATNGYAIVYIRGRTVESVACGLVAIEVAGAARPVMTRAAAFAKLRDTFPEEQDKLPADLASGLRLCFVWSPDHNLGDPPPPADTSVLSPQWAFGRDRGLLIDAYTGRVWRND